MSKYLSIKQVLIGWSKITCSNFTVNSNGIGWSSSLEPLIYYSFAAKSPYLQLSVIIDITKPDTSVWPLHIKLDLIIWVTLLNYEVACKDTGCYPFCHRSTLPGSVGIYGHAFLRQLCIYPMKCKMRGCNVNVTTICMQLLCDLFSDVLVRGLIFLQPRYCVCYLI